MTKVERLEKRLEQVSGAGKVWIPSWLSAVGSAEEIVEWKTISHSYHGSDRRDRELEFEREMRKRHPDMPLTVDEVVEEGGRQYAASELARQKAEEHPDMPLTFNEQLEAGVKELKKNPALRRREGLDPVESYADERGGE
jgi:hypothetical protein